MIPTPQIFIVHSQPQLLAKSYNPTQQELQFGKNSLIEKYKISNGTQQLLFCKKINQGQEEFMSINEKNIIQTQRKKYIDFIKKNYNEKISQELFNINKLKHKIRQFQTKQLQEKHRQDELNVGKKGTKINITQAQKRKTEDKKVTSGKKKIKTEAPNEQKIPATKGKKIQPKKQVQKPIKAPQVKEAQQVEQIMQDPSESQSLDLGLNSLSQEYNVDE